MADLTAVTLAWAAAAALNSDLIRLVTSALTPGNAPVFKPRRSLLEDFDADSAADTLGSQMLRVIIWFFLRCFFAWKWLDGVCDSLWSHEGLADDFPGREIMLPEHEAMTVRGWEQTCSRVSYVSVMHNGPVQS